METKNIPCTVEGGEIIGRLPRDPKELSFRATLIDVDYFKTMQEEPTEPQRKDFQESIRDFCAGCFGMCMKGSKEEDSKVTCSKEVKPKETKPIETKPVDKESKDTEPKDKEPKDTEPKDAEPKEAEPKEPKPEEPQPIQTND